MSHLVSKARAPRLVRKEESKERREKKEEEGEGEEEQRYVFFFFFMESSVFWMSRVIGVIARVFLWRLICSKPRVLVERSHKPLIC